MREFLKPYHKMSKKGLSFEEKQKKMLEIFFETQDFFQLKELEKMAPKKKGIVSQSVKDVTQSLVDDGLICLEKIGSSNYYWSFPSTALKNRKRKLNDIEQKISDIASNISTKRQRLETIGSDFDEQDGLRAKKLDDLVSLRKKHLCLKNELNKFKDLDPSVIEAKSVATTAALEAANRWTDNIFSLKSWVKSKRPELTDEAISSIWHIPDDLDYIEL